MSWVTQAEYSRHRGWRAKSYVAKLISSGKIPKTAVRGEGKSRRVNLEAADLALGETIERVVARAPAEPDDDDQGGAAGAGSDPTGAGAGLTKARTASAYYQANLARLQFEQKSGKLVARADVEVSMQRAAEALGRDIDQLATWADDVATAFTRNGVDGVRALLKQLSRVIRANLAANMRLLESETETETAPAEAGIEDQAA